ncbi:Ser/Thr protein phosphatase [Tritrichomonas foetus]|uniref:Serine/threonine-protein phosphatase n=1 Tax=Tritrichomonas foetus TaxID=1144522 RepID=A0A1J4KBE1_9EUKA|nr:Ser/Thr protein phosphatase [Tritrichomonas foetus]|eukprot:OHT07004.1 Ser/Thr protein phosphatase [Tritrichomonas foetus]
MPDTPQSSTSEPINTKDDSSTVNQNLNRRMKSISKFSSTAELGSSQTGVPSSFVPGNLHTSSINQNILSMANNYKLQNSIKDNKNDELQNEDFNNGECNLPKFDEQTLIELCDYAQTKLFNVPPLVRIPTDTYIIGDIHGNIRDLIRILNQIKFPLESRIVFLGDYVDRGDFSIEVAVLTLALFCTYPDKVVLLRGNHEILKINAQYGFKDQVLNEYNSEEVWMAFNNTFLYYPLACIVGEDNFCVHGGISPLLYNLSQIYKCNAKELNLNDQLVVDMLWSDPTSENIMFQNSSRGNGHVFGRNALISFFNENKLTRMFRGHQCVSKGIEISFENMIYTVFSCSNYCNIYYNLAGYCYINDENRVYSTLLPVLRELKKEDVYFIPFSTKSNVSIRDVNCFKSNKRMIRTNRRAMKVSSIGSVHSLKMLNSHSIYNFSQNATPSISSVVRPCISSHSYFTKIASESKRRFGIPSYSAQKCKIDEEIPIENLNVETLKLNDDISLEDDL